MQRFCQLFDFVGSTIRDWDAGWAAARLARFGFICLDFGPDSIAKLTSNFELIFLHSNFARRPSSFVQLKNMIHEAVEIVVRHGRDLR